MWERLKVKGWVVRAGEITCRASWGAGLEGRGFLGSRGEGGQGYGAEVGREPAWGLGFWGSKVGLLEWFLLLFRKLCPHTVSSTPP